MHSLINKRNLSLLSLVIFGAAVIYSTSPKENHANSVVNESGVSEDSMLKTAFISEHTGSKTNAQVSDTTPVRLPASVELLNSHAEEKHHEHSDECTESIKIAAENLKNLELDATEEKQAEEEIEKTLLEAKNEFENFILDDDGNLIEKVTVISAFENEIVEFEEDAVNHIEVSSEFEIN
jgi:hypothetical protein